MLTIDFPRPVASADGRTLHSTTTITRNDDGSRIELDISTSHWKGRGYRAHATRQYAHGVMRRVSFGFGEDSDSRPLPSIDGAPAANARFNRAVLARLHEQVMADILTAAAEWTDWAKGCVAARD